MSTVTCDDGPLLDDGRLGRRAGPGADDVDLGVGVAVAPLVTVMPVMAPSAPTVASAVAPVPLPVMTTWASGSVNGLFAQFG